MNPFPPEIWLLSATPAFERDRPGARREVARGLAGALDQSAHIEGDVLARQVIAGAALPGDAGEGDAAEEVARQVELCVRNQCLLARSYAEAGFTPIVDYGVRTAHLLDAYRHYLAGGQLRFFVLTNGAIGANEEDALDRAMREDLAAVGLWIEATTPVDTAEAIRAGSKEALLR